MLESLPAVTAYGRPRRAGGLAGYTRVVLLALSAVALLGLTTRAEDEIPETDQSFSAEIVDVSGARTTGDHVSVEGVTYFSVRRGSTTLFVPFARLQSVESAGEVEDEDGVDRIEATFTFQDGTTERGLLKSRETLYGASKLGNFQLRLGELRSIRFLGSTPATSATAAAPDEDASN
jgi:hypothetical protein